MKKHLIIINYIIIFATFGVMHNSWYQYICQNIMMGCNILKGQNLQQVRHHLTQIYFLV